MVEYAVDCLGRFCRPGKYFEKLPATEEGWIFAAKTEFMTHRLAHVVSSDTLGLAVAHRQT
jgi:hypothetical protein